MDNLSAPLKNFSTVKIHFPLFWLVNIETQDKLSAAIAGKMPLPFPTDHAGNHLPQNLAVFSTQLRVSIQAATPSVDAV